MSSFTWIHCSASAVSGCQKPELDVKPPLFAMEFIALRVCEAKLEALSVLEAVNRRSSLQVSRKVKKRENVDV